MRSAHLGGGLTCSVPPFATIRRGAAHNAAALQICTQRNRVPGPQLHRQLAWQIHREHTPQVWVASSMR